MGNLLQDLRYALRILARSPVFTTVAVLSLALGIGANTAIFTLVDQMLLRLLPVKHPEQLVLVATRGSHYGNNRGANALSYPIYQDFRDQNQVFNGLLCRFGLPLSMSFNGQTERVAGELVSGNYFDVLGVWAALGRTITPDDDKIPGGHPLVVLSHAFWKSRFAADPSIVGQTLNINGYAMTVIGVSQEGFDGTELGNAPQVRIPILMKAQMTPSWDDLKNRRSRWVNVYGRLKPGVSADRAKAAMQPLYHQMLEMEVQQEAFRHASAYTRERFLQSTMVVTPAEKGGPGFRGRYEKPLWVLMGIVGLVLLIACANVAGLLMARATSRQKEIAVRLALGAGRSRLVSQLLVESVLLAAIGGVVGLALAAWTDRLLIGLMPQGNAPLAISSSPDLRILGFNLAVSFLTGILFGLIPALQATKPDLAGTLKDQAGAVLGGAHVRLRKVLVVAQVGLSLLLLIGAGLFIRSLRNLKTLDPGFRTESLIAFRVDPSLNGYKKERTQQFYRQLLESLPAVPGARSAALASVPLLLGWEWDSTITVEGYEAKPGESMNPYFNSVSPGYFATLGIPLVAGHDFSLRDDLIAPKVCIINELLARHYFGDRSPLGRHIGFGGDPGVKADIEIVGVVKDSKYTSVRDEIPRQVFVPFLQSGFVTEMAVYTRTGIDPQQMFTALRREVQKLDADLPVYSMKTMEVQLDESLVSERLIASLSTVFGLLATVLAVIGLYGVMAYMVARRTREIGIRMALGAASGNVVWLIMREVLTLVGIGVAIGLPAAWGLTRLVQTQLFGITPNDPATIVLATLALAAVACLAGYVPALRATRVDPTQALRYE